MSKSGVYRVGVFGGMGSGKSTVMGMLRDLGANVLDADKINAALPADAGYMRGVAALCPAVIKEGALDKAVLRDWVLADEANRQALMALAHPLIAAEIDRIAHEGVWFVEFSVYVPGLVRLDESWHVTCGRQRQIARILARGGWREEEARVLIAAQTAAGTAPADARLIVNDGGLDELRARVGTLYQAVIART